MHLVFLELDSHHLHLDFQLLNENSNVIITRKLHLQLLETRSKIYSDLNPTAPQDPQTYRLKKLNELKHIYLMELKLVKDKQKR